MRGCSARMRLGTARGRRPREARGWIGGDAYAWTSPLRGALSFFSSAGRRTTARIYSIRGAEVNFFSPRSEFFEASKINDLREMPAAELIQGRISGRGAPAHFTTDLSCPNRILRSASVRMPEGAGFTSFARAYARSVAGRARIAAFQRLRFGNSSMSCPWRSGMIHGYDAMSAIEYCLPSMKSRPVSRLFRTP